MSEIAQPRIHKLTLESSSFCNQPCGFCFATFQTPPDVAAAVQAEQPGMDTDSTLTTEEVKARVIDPFADMYGSVLHFTGGDPFLRQDLPELIAHAQSRGLQVSVDTNCIVIVRPHNRQMFNVLTPRLYRVGIPIDTMDESLQISMRAHKLASWAPLQFLQMAQQLRPTVEHFPQVKVNTLATSLNYRHIPGMVNGLEPYIISGLIGRWSIDKFRPMERGAVHAALYDIDEDTYRHTVRAVRSELVARGMRDIVTGDQPKVGTGFIISPQGIAYVPGDTEKHFVPMSVRGASLQSIIGRSVLVSRDEQYKATLGGMRGDNHLYRHPAWEAKLITLPTDSSYRPNR